MKKDIESQVIQEEKAGWIPSVDKQDILAGVTVGVMAIPQSMAYAMLADLPPIHGLYTALVPAVVYALMGDSRQMHVGPVSMVSLITATAIKNSGVTSPADKVLVSVMLAMVGGLFQILMGMLKMGALVSFATLPIISGFTAGASVVVIVAQSQHIFGITVKSGATTVHTAVRLVSKVTGEGFDTYSLGLGVIFILCLWGAKSMSTKHSERFPALKAAGPLFVVCFGTAVTYLLRLDGKGVKIIGSVPNGLPGLTDLWGVIGMRSVLPTIMSSGLAIGFISFMESIAVAKTLAHRNGYEIDANKELVAVGCSNIAGSLFNAYASAGAFSRSAVASETGAKSQAAAVFASVVVGVTLLFLTPLFYFLPKGVLSAIVIHAVWGLIKVSDLTRLISLYKRDAALWVIAFIGTLYSVNVGLLTAVAFSIILIVKDSSQPQLERLGKLTRGQTVVYVPVNGSPDAVLDTDVLVVSISGILHGGGANVLKARLQGFVAEQQKRGAETCHVVLDMTHVTNIDTTALAALTESVTAIKGESKAQVAYCGLKSDLQKMVTNSAALADVPAPHLMQTVSEAIDSLSDLSVQQAKMRSASASW